MGASGGAGTPGVDLLAETDDQAALRQLARDVAEREVGAAGAPGRRGRRGAGRGAQGPGGLGPVAHHGR